MSLALYRKYRPQSFGEVIGQEHVTAPLISAIDNGRLNHAYLFSGPRGCGKTSSARILARSLNCEKGPTSTPCGVCDSCVALSTGGGGSIDVIEIDAASHGGVDDARELRERAVFAPVNSRFKVYVIDEAHMVSSAGFNALLKLVEEPPDYVVFVFATTEPDKVLPTIRSRTHHYPFRLIPPTAMQKLCEQLCDAEGVMVDPMVYPLVIRAGGGSARDTLSVLDQLIAGAGPDGVTYERTVSLLGVTDSALLDSMCDALASMDGSGAMACVDRVIADGHDPRRFTSDLLERLRDLIVLNQVPDAASQGLINVPAEQLERMTGQALRMGTATLSRMAEIMHDALNAMRGTTAPRLLLELACAKAILPAVDESAAGLLQRLEQLEHRAAGASMAAPVSAPVMATPAPAPASVVHSPAPVTPPPAPEASRPAAQETPAAPARPTPTNDDWPAPVPSVAGPVEAAPAEAPPVASVPSGPVDVDRVRSLWEQIKHATKTRKQTVGAFVREAAVVGVEADTLVLSFTHSFHASALQKDAAMTVFTDVLSEVLGGRWRVRCEVGAASTRTAPPPNRAAPTAPAQPAPPPAAPASPAPTAPVRKTVEDDPSWPSEPPPEDEPPPDGGSAWKGRSSAPTADFAPLAGGIAEEDEAIALLQSQLGARRL